MIRLRICARRLRVWVRGVTAVGRSCGRLRSCSCSIRRFSRQRGRDCVYVSSACRSSRILRRCCRAPGDGSAVFRSASLHSTAPTGIKRPWRRDWSWFRSENRVMPLIWGFPDYFLALFFFFFLGENRRMLSEGSKRAELMQYECGEKQLRHHLADRFHQFYNSNNTWHINYLRQTAMTPDIVEDLHSCGCHAFALKCKNLS